MLSGRATPEGTQRRSAGRPGYRVLGSTGLTTSVVGFGGYRTGRSDPAHRAALRAALQAGVNLVDTSSNYMFGDSERLVGEVLAEGLVPRDEVVVVTKIGYVQGPNLELAIEREREGRPFPEMVKYAEGVWHCMSPEFLEDQLARALERLGLETVDVLLLHNPEYYLSEAAHRDPPPPLDEMREIYYGRLRKAFAHLEGMVRDGRIAAYGVSSNTYVNPPDDPEATSVARVAEMSLGKLSVLQLPYNLLETGALLERNTPDGTALDTARKRNLGVLVNRPLNAMGPRSGGRLVRLADPPRAEGPAGDDALRARVAALDRREVAFRQSFPGAEGPRVAPLLRLRWDQLGSSGGLAHAFRGELAPEARRGLSALVAATGGRPADGQLAELQAYQEDLNALFERLQARLHRQDPRVTAAIRTALEPHLPPELRAESLSRIALAFVASTPGVTCALNGMRDPAYVADAVGVLGLPPIPDVKAVARALG
jgi:aryl-alcohol dehydrogenase-like predicted oxidoreductase